MFEGPTPRDARGTTAAGVARLHVVTPADTGTETCVALWRILSAGARHVQVRTKMTGDRDRLAFAAAVRGLCTPAGARVVINDRADIALACGAAGVHVGDGDLPPETARRLLGPEAIIGVTCRDPEAARRAADAGASYLGVGPAYTTTTKPGLPDPLGPRGIAAVASAVDLPVIAIAGVTAERVPELLGAGAHGVAVVSALFRAPDPAVATAAFLEVLPCT